VIRTTVFRRRASEPCHLRRATPGTADQLRLRTTYGGDTTQADHAVWADAKLR
jgi:hypothetical protein